MNRCVSPEWLDELPAHDPRAIRSRQDLRRINAIMGHGRIIRKELANLAASAAGAPRRIVEAGAGDGAFMLCVVKALGKFCAGAEVVLVDRQPAEASEKQGAWKDLGCHATRVIADVFEWLGDSRTPPADVIVANLFLHHFPDDRLRSLLSLMASKATLVIACEPRRSMLSLAGARLVGCIGCNHVTRHDAVVSVRAGFAGRELTAAWPQEPGWKVTEYSSGPFSHCFVARRL